MQIWGFGVSECYRYLYTHAHAHTHTPDLQLNICDDEFKSKV